jgi:hypothetical protein
MRGDCKDPDTQTLLRAAQRSRNLTNLGIGNVVILIRYMTSKENYV